MSASRLILFAIVGCWPLAAGASNCNNTIADAGARAVLRAIDTCPDHFFGSRQAYLSYAKQAILGIAVPGATAAAGALAVEKAGENAFFCISGALIDNSGSNDRDKAFLKALLEVAKENIDRADFASKLLDLRQGLIEKGAAAYLGQGEVETFIKTLDATIAERIDGLDKEGTLVGVGQERYDSPENRARETTAQAEALARECRYGEAEIALTQAQELNLEYLGELRAEVSKAKHLRYCIERDARRQQTNALDPVSPFLQHSLQRADADIAEAMRREAEQIRLVGELANYQRTVHTHRNDVDALKQRAARQLDAARQAAGECQWDRADSLLESVSSETLQCALQLDAERRARDELAAQIEQAKQQFAQLEVVHIQAIATPFSELVSCGELSLLADHYDSFSAQCREWANLESKVGALRNRARACADFKGAKSVQDSVPLTPTGSLLGRVTLSPIYKEDHGERGYIQTTYADTLVTYERVDLASQMRATIVWSYNGVPASLSPGQAVTITVTGGVISEQPPGAAGGLALSGNVYVYGDVTLKTAQQADRGHPSGLYEFIVNSNPQNVEIQLGGAPMGTGIVWKYTK